MLNKYFLIKLLIKLRRYFFLLLHFKNTNLIDIITLIYKASIFLRNTISQMDPENPIIRGMDKINSEFYVDKSKIIGRGNYSTYYKGYHVPTNQTIAVKFVPMKIYMTFP